MKMRQIISAIHNAGLTLKDFRGKSKADRALLWTMVLMNVQLITADYWDELEPALN